MGLPFSSAAGWDLCFEVSIFPLDFYRDAGEQGRSRGEIHRNGNSWQRVSAATVSPSKGGPVYFAGATSPRSDVGKAPELFRHCVEMLPPLSTGQHL